MPGPKCARSGQSVERDLVYSFDTGTNLLRTRTAQQVSVRTKELFETIQDNVDWQFIGSLQSWNGYVKRL